MISFSLKINVTCYRKNRNCPTFWALLLLYAIRAKSFLLIHSFYYIGALWPHPSIKSCYSHFIAFSLHHPHSFMRESRYFKKAKELAVRIIRLLKYLKTYVRCPYLWQNIIYGSQKKSAENILGVRWIRLCRCLSFIYYTSLDHLTSESIYFLIVI